MVIKMEYVVIAVILLIILLAILKANKKDAGLDFNKLVEYLGGKDNIIDTEINLSRFKVTLKDIGGQSLIPSLSNFENGKLFRYEYMYFYIMACQDEQQLHKLESLVSQIIYNAWKRGECYDQKN